MRLDQTGRGRWVKGRGLGRVRDSREGALTGNDQRVPKDWIARQRKPSLASRCRM